MQFFDKAETVQETFNGLGVSSGVRVTLDVGDTKDDLHVHVNLREKKWWSGGVEGFMGNNADSKMGLGGGVVSGRHFVSLFCQFKTNQLSAPSAVRRLALSPRRRCLVYSVCVIDFFCMHSKLFRQRSTLAWFNLSLPHRLCSLQN